MPFFEAVRLALQTIRAQKLKSTFSIIGVFIGVMFLIAVVSVVQGMNRYMTDKFAGTILGVNTFRLRQFPDVRSEEHTSELPSLAYLVCRLLLEKKKKEERKKRRQH